MLSLPLLWALGTCRRRWVPVVCIVVLVGRQSCPTLSRLKFFDCDRTLPSAGQPCHDIVFPCRDRSSLGLAKILSRHKTFRCERETLPLATSLFDMKTFRLLSASPCGSCILDGLALLLLVFRVDTISN